LSVVGYFAAFFVRPPLFFRAPLALFFLSPAGFRADLASAFGFGFAPRGRFGVLGDAVCDSGVSTPAGVAASSNTADGRSVT